MSSNVPTNLSDPKATSTKYIVMAQFKFNPLDTDLQFSIH